MSTESDIIRNFVITQTSAYEPIRENGMSELSASGNLKTAHTHQFRRSKFRCDCPNCGQNVLTSLKISVFSFFTLHFPTSASTPCRRNDVARNQRTDWRREFSSRQEPLILRTYAASSDGRPVVDDRLARRSSKD